MTAIQAFTDYNALHNRLDQYYTLKTKAQPTLNSQTGAKRSDNMPTDHMADCHIKY